MNLFGHDPDNTWICDIETDSLDARWDTDVRAYLLGSMRVSDGEYRIGPLDTTLPPEGSTLVFHNASFDVAVLRTRGYKVTDYFCTMVASHTLNPGSSDEHSLGSLVPGVKVSLRELLAQSGFDMSRVKKGEEYTWYGTGKEEVDKIVEVYLVKDLIATRELYLSLLDKYLHVPEQTLQCMLKVNQPYIERILEMQQGIRVAVDHTIEDSLRASQQESLAKAQTIVGPLEQDPREYRKGNGTHGPNCKVKHFNPGSNQQVGLALKELYGWTPKKYTDKKAPCVSTEVLESLDYPLVAPLLEYTKVTKLLSFYDGLAGLSWVRPSYNQCATRTTRLSCSNPNIQQIPSRDPVGKQLRKAFRARDGYTLLVGDQSGFQLRILAAYLSYYFEEHRLTQCFNEGLDVHQFFADIYGIDRKVGKNVSFGYLFGAGIPKMTSTANRGNPNPIKEKVIKGALKSLQEKMPALPELKTLFVDAAIRDKGVFTDWMGARYTVPELLSTDTGVRASGERKVFNYAIQGLEASLFRHLQNLAAPLVHEYGGRQCLVVHDEVAYEVPESVAEELAPKLSALMSPALGDFTPWVDKSDLEGLRLECEFGMGADWYTAK